MMTMSMGLKFFFAAEAARQIGARVGRGMKFAAERAQETEVAFREFPGQPEAALDEVRDRDVIAELAKPLWGDPVADSVFVHGKRESAWA
jgi:hypothetical protein